MARLPPHPHFPPAPPKSKRRWGLLIAGIVGALFATIVLVAGWVVAMGSSLASTIDPIGKAKTPNVIKFDADAGKYELHAVHERRGGSIGSAAHFDCSVTLADSRVIRIDASAQVVAAETANTQRIAPSPPSRARRRSSATPGATARRSSSTRSLVGDKQRSSRRLSAP